ncbi:MAG TPA: Nramp family divalent metal transporter [Patescibacteria group bacterium]|nr:Nramp family divalent metal transporter [Patescibacteria group bacterium]
MLRKWYGKLILVFGIMGPAIIAGTANNDAGGISTYSFAGSRFGYMMLWVLVFNFITLAVTQEIGIRLGAHTGKGLSALIREQFGVRWAFFAIAALYVANLAVTVSEFAGIAVAMEIFHIPKLASVPLFAVIIWLVLYKGSFKKVERFFLMISLFFLVYIVSAVMAGPNWGEVLSASFTPSFSSEPLYLFTLLGLMGTTITPWGQFFIQSYVVDKGVTPGQYKVEKWEVVFSALFTCLIAAMIIITTKQVLFDNGIVVDSAEKAALSLQPVLGSLAKNIFGAGFFFASLLGAFVLPLTTSYSICEALGFEHGVDRTWKEAPTFYGMMAFTIILSAVFVMLSVFPLFHIMIFAQVVNGILLPIILIFLVIILNRGQKIGLPKGSRIGRIFYNLITWEAIIRLSLISILLVALTLFPDLLSRLFG